MERTVSHQEPNNGAVRNFSSISAVRSNCRARLDGRVDYGTANLFQEERFVSAAALHRHHVPLLLGKIRTAKWRSGYESSARQCSTDSDVRNVRGSTSSSLCLASGENERCSPPRVLPRTRCAAFVRSVPTNDAAES